MKVYRSGKLDMLATIKANTPTPRRDWLERQRNSRKQRESAARARQGARIAHFGI